MDIIIGAGQPKDKASIPLGTRRGNHIPNERRLERPPAALKVAAQLHTKEHPNVIVRSKTSVYNCMGLVFASRRTWIDPVYLKTILNEDDYYRLASEEAAQAGDIVVYRHPKDNSVSHVGVILRIEPKVNIASWDITVMSQWGADGEYIHSIDDLPEFLGEVLYEFWTDRR